MIAALIFVCSFASQRTASSAPTSLPAYFYVPGKSYYHHANCKLVERRLDLEPATQEIIKAKSLNRSSRDGLRLGFAQCDERP
jgi:hypothetical protein